jgi:hypothetical protein
MLGNNCIVDVWKNVGINHIIDVDWNRLMLGNVEKYLHRLMLENIRNNCIVDVEIGWCWKMWQ